MYVHFDDSDWRLVTDLKRLVQSLGASETSSLPKLWGALLTRGFDPADINMVLAELQSEGGIGVPQSAGCFRKIALSKQGSLLSSLAKSMNGRSVTTQSDDEAAEQFQRKLQEAEVITFTDDRQISIDLHRMLRRIGISKLRKVKVTDNLHGESFDASLDFLEHSNCRLFICATCESDWWAADAVNRISVKKGCPVIYYRIHGMQAQVGPMVIPGVTACFECFRIRRNSHVAPWERTFVESISDTGRLTATLGLDWVAVDVIKLITEVGEPVSRGRLMFIDYFSGLPELHSVLRIPRCSVCGPPRKPQVRLWEEL